MRGSARGPRAGWPAPGRAAGGTRGAARRRSFGASSRPSERSAGRGRRRRRADRRPADGGDGDERARCRLEDDWRRPGRLGADDRHPDAPRVGLAAGGRDRLAGAAPSVISATGPRPHRGRLGASGRPLRAPSPSPARSGSRGGPAALGRRRAPAAPGAPRRAAPAPPRRLRSAPAVPVLADPAGRQRAGTERRVGGHEAMERQGGLDAADLGLVEGPPEPVDRRVAVAGVDHHLGDQVVVLGRHPVARLDAPCPPGRPGPTASASARPGPGVGREVPARILGRQADLDRVARRLGGPGGRRERRLRQRPARRPGTAAPGRCPGRTRARSRRARPGAAC